MCYAHTKRPTQPIYSRLILSRYGCLCEWLSTFQIGIVEMCVCVCLYARRWNEIELINIELGDYLFIGQPLTLWPLKCGIVSHFAVIIILGIIITMVVAVVTPRLLLLLLLLKFGRFFLIILSGVLRLSAYFLLLANRSPSVISLSGVYAGWPL